MSESPRFIRRNFSSATVRSDVSLGSQIRMFSAQATSVETDSARSISGRLGGGRFDGLRASRGGSSSANTLRLAIDSPTEGTGLLIPRSPMLTRKFSSLNDLESLGADADAGPPTLAVWICPALCCATAYALYNVSYDGWMER